MKNKKIKTIINLIIVFVCCVIMFATESQAIKKATPSPSINSWINQGNAFINQGASATPVIQTSEIKNTVIPIAQALVAIATVVLVAVTIIMGIKYMMCQGDAQEKAKLKTQLIGLVVSTLVIFGAQTIWALIYDFMNQITG